MSCPRGGRASTRFLDRLLSSQWPAPQSSWPIVTDSGRLPEPLDRVYSYCSMIYMKTQFLSVSSVCFACWKSNGPAALPSSQPLPGDPSTVRLPQRRPAICSPPLPWCAPKSRPWPLSASPPFYPLFRLISLSAQNNCQSSSPFLCSSTNAEKRSISKYMISTFFLTFHPFSFPRSPPPCSMALPENPGNPLAPGLFLA
jgi:hypothetical protein